MRTTSEAGHGSFLPSPALSPLRDAPLVPGYEILSVLGEGGMGTVYKAWHLTLNRPVALKMVREDRKPTKSQLARFRLEAQHVARLHHPNIIEIHDAGEVDGKPYFSMEYME